ncbi:MAG: RES family NAD+ phosphorylase [Noviherbaspirillum sp.]
MAGTLHLEAPPADINSRNLDIALVPPASLCRVSRHSTGEPYFGRTGDCRFDDAQPDVTKRFGTCYLGFNLTVAFAESVLHNLEPDASGFSVPTTEVSSRFALSFKAPRESATLKLAKLYGTALLRLGGNGELSGTPDYTLPQAWAAALVAHSAKIDGLIYMSRRVNDSFAVVLFERDPVNRLQIRIDQTVPLHHHPEYLAAARDLGVTLI